MNATVAFRPSIGTWNAGGPPAATLPSSSGNLEMQRMNTGLPGYKLKGVAGLKNMIADGMKPVYRGGSSYVAA